MATKETPRNDDGRIQIVGRLPKTVSRDFRATAKRLGLTLNASLIAAIDRWVIEAPKAATKKTAAKKPAAAA